MPTGLADGLIAINDVLLILVASHALWSFQARTGKNGHEAGFIRQRLLQS